MGLPSANTPASLAEAERLRPEPASRCRTRRFAQDDNRPGRAPSERPADDPVARPAHSGRRERWNPRRKMPRNSRKPCISVLLGTGPWERRKFKHLRQAAYGLHRVRRAPQHGNRSWNPRSRITVSHGRQALAPGQALSRMPMAPSTSAPRTRFGPFTSPTGCPLRPASSCCGCASPAGAAILNGAYRVPPVVEVK
jgi:hypothetical protein